MASGFQHDRRSSRTVLKVVILGDGGVGKTSLMQRFISNHFDPTTLHTVGVEFLKKNLQVDNQTCTLQIWDTAGQERFRSLRTPFYRGSDICMLTFALDNRSSFENLLMWFREFNQYADIDDALSFPFLVVGNKSDLSASSREVSRSEAELWCKENGPYPYIETSAKDASNVQEAFMTISRAAVQVNASLDRKGFSAGHGADTVDLFAKSGDTAGRRCC